MLTVKRYAGVAPEVNSRNLFHAGKRAHKGDIHPGFETQSRSPKQGYQLPHKKDLMSSIFF